jgi:hypothetical protein
MFYVNNGCHITDASFIGQNSTNGAAIVALQPLLGVSTDRFFDGARMVRLNLDYIARESVGFLTSGFSGFAGGHREQDAAKLIDANLEFIAGETVGFLTSPLGYNFNLGISSYTNCREDIVSIMNAVSYDLKAGSNRKSIGAGYSYFSNSNSLIHITGIGVSQATIAALDYAAEVAKYVINNTTPPTSYQGIGNSVSQVKNLSVIQVPGGCVGVGTTIRQLVGIVTNMIGAGTTENAPAVRYGVTLESKDCSDDVKDIWKCVIHDITRGGNSRSVSAGKAYYNDNGSLKPGILKNPEEVQQTIATVEYSFNIARAVINNCSWGGYPVGLGTTVVNAVYDFESGITTVTAYNHGLTKNDPVQIKNLNYECSPGSSGYPVGVVTASYDRLTGISTITTSSSLDIKSGNRVKIENLVFECNSGGGPSTALYPSGTFGYDFTVQDVLDSNTFVSYVGKSTLDHRYQYGGSVSRLYTPIFGISTASYDYLTGITTITAVGLDTGPHFYIEPGKKVKLENLVFECNSGGGPSTASYPSGNLGYDFTVIATTDNRYIDAANLIENNKIEIVDKSLAAIAIAHSDFYFPYDIQTTRFSRYKDSYRLIQQNRTEIVDSAWTATLAQYPGISATQTKCKRDLGYFVDAISTDIFTGGNSYSIAFVKQYFNSAGPISNGLVGEETESVYAFNEARNLMKSAITNQLTVKDLTLTPDPVTGSNVNSNSCSNVQNTLNTLTSIITTVISSGSLTSLNTIRINTGIFVSSENKCRRDIGYIVDALAKDIRYGTNKYIREATLAYFDKNGNPISNGLVGETAESVTAFNAVRDYAKKAITNQLNIKNLTLTADPATGNNQDPNSCANVRTNIDNLIGIITTTITNGNLSQYPRLYVSNTVKVNVGVSTLPHIYKNGGTLTSNYTTNIFPDGTYNYIFPVKSVVGPNTFEFVGGKTVLPHTYVSGGTVQKYQNFQNEYSQVKDLSIQPDPKTGYNDVISSCTDVTSAMRSCVGIVTSIVGYGLSAFSVVGFNTSYPGNRGKGFESIVGITSAVYEETSGKTTIKAPGLPTKVGDLIEIRNLTFSCSSGGPLSNQIFPSGYYGYEFYITKIYPDESFDIYTGVSTIPHSYVSGGYVINRSLNVTEAKYDNLTGIVTITSPGISVRPGDFVTLRDLEFYCTSGAGTTTLYPTGNNGYAFKVISTTNEKDTFTVNVGKSGIGHTYVTGGVVLPPYSKGVGPITQGPYIRNCTNFIGDSIGMKVDGFEAEPGDQDDIGVTGTMSVDSYTQYNQGGIGVSITNGAYSQLVSIFTICDDIGIFTKSGGQCDITNSNASFGNYGLVSDGVGDNESKSIYRYTGNVYELAKSEDDTIKVSGVGKNRPYDGQAIYFDRLYYFVDRIEVTNGGSGYSESNPPLVTFSFPDGPNGIRAEGSVNVIGGKVVSIDVISSGTQYETAPTITFSGGGGNGATAEPIMYPIYYGIESATLPENGISEITLTQTLNNDIGVGTTVYFSRISLQIATSISLEWVGAGTNINTAKPALGGVTIQANEVDKRNGGQVVYTSTNQAGNFQIGEGVVINQLTGTISGRSFSQSLLNTVTPLIIALGR